MNEALYSMSSSTAVAASDALDDIPVAYVEIDTQGVITRANRAARLFHSESERELIGRSIFEFSPAQEVDADRAAFLAMLESGDDPKPIRRALYRDHGGFRTIELHRTLMRDAVGRVSGVRSVSIDVTEAQMAHEDAHQARQWLESVLEAIAEAVIVTDALGFVRTLNPAAERLFGYKSAELVGKPIEKGLPILCYSDTAAAPPSFSMAIQKPLKVLVTMLDRERNEMKVEIGTSPILDKETGYILGVVSVWRRLDHAC
jgi:PAS domain S-box-containing protein